MIGYLTFKSKNVCNLGDNGQGAESENAEHVCTLYVYDLSLKMKKYAYFKN